MSYPVTSGDVCRRLDTDATHNEYCIFSLFERNFKLALVINGPSGRYMNCMMEYLNTSNSRKKKKMSRKICCQLPTDFPDNTHYFQDI